MDVKELLKTTPETLAERQYAALLSGVQDTLDRLMALLREGNFAEAERMLFTSPAGDGYGMDNMCISFDHLMEGGEQQYTDVGDVVAKLRELRGHMRKMEGKR